jgi:tRNA dimethylallyltransferase
LPASTQPLLIAIVGPTGSGKTALALVLAQHFGGEIVNCDSVALYRGFEIGTARPSFEGRARVPHHLLDIIEPTAVFTAGDYAQAGRRVVAEIAARERLPIVVGGTGFYLRALLEGLFAGPKRSEGLRARLREIVAREGSLHLHRILARLDAAAAARIHANDEPKLIRAIEVCLAARQKMTELWQHGRDPLTGFDVLRIGLDPERTALYERINQRARRMFDSGLVEETERLVARYGASAPLMQSLGYKQALQLLRGEVDRESAIAAVQRAHRNYAKRQMTWFRREPDVHWLRGFGDDPQIQSRAIAVVEENARSATGSR